ncbi:MAG: hypothetical protein JZD40_00170 [Sulfolobus sp.]|nr:hypothetical protein [Sulfolobus sp.]
MDIILPLSVLEDILPLSNFSGDRLIILYRETDWSLSSYLSRVYELKTIRASGELKKDVSRLRKLIRETGKNCEYLVILGRDPYLNMISIYSVMAECKKAVLTWNGIEGIELSSKGKKAKMVRNLKK